MQCDWWNVETLTAPHPATGLTCSWVLQFKQRSYKKGQRDAPFLKFVLTKNSTCFGQIFCPSSGDLLHFFGSNMFVILVMMTVSYRGKDGTPGVPS